ncbi:MAG: hypothetical protein WD989_02760 [Candidatus Paceibacterota bacterium]
MIFITFIGYNLGRINALKQIPISVKSSDNLNANVFDATNSKSETLNSKQSQNSKSQTPKLDRRVVRSKNSDKYHFTWCSGAKRIKEENKIWFETEAAALAAGYTKAGNCN